MKQSAAGLAGLCAGSVLQIACGGTSDRPNIVLIVSDDTGWNDVGYHGSEIRTPNIDRLAREGVELDHFYAHPVCSPTRASLLTGRPPSRYGILDPIAGDSRQTLPSDTITLAEFLRRNGYQTAITGKWHLGLSFETGPRKYGFDYSYGYLHGQIDPYTHLYKYGDSTWHRNDELIDEEGHVTDLITAEALKMIKTFKDASRPFFLYVAYSVPHFPLDEPPQWTDSYAEITDGSRRLYAASMTHMDHGIGMILKALKEEGIERETLVIYFSDNGGQEKWGADPSYYSGRYAPQMTLGSNLPLRGWKGDVYEGGIRVPAVMAWPGRLKKSRVAEPIAVQDLYPTIAGLIGVSPPEAMKIEGMDVWGAVTGRSALPQRVLYWRRPEQLAVRRGRWKFVVQGSHPNAVNAELFNLETDPGETCDIANGIPDIAAAMEAELNKQFAKDMDHAF